jgi:redox-regulated HSP33 family molecular chaperone
MAAHDGRAGRQCAIVCGAIDFAGARPIFRGHVRSAPTISCIASSSSAPAYAACSCAWTDSWQQVRGRAEYPPALADLLGRTLAASALFTGNVKFDGALSIQIKNAGPVNLLFAECGSDGHVRGLARWAGDLADESAVLGAQPAPLLAITIDNRTSGQRYQGLVPVEDAHLATLFERYFERSEQLPTRVVLACGEGTLRRPDAAAPARQRPCR